MNSFIKMLKKIKRFVFLKPNERKAVENLFPLDNLNTRILCYKISPDTQRHRSVIYTCITGGYDELIQPTYYNKEWDYICFTDNTNWLDKRKIGVWHIKPLVYNERSNQLNNRWHKLFPHKLFPEYDSSIYIDGNVDILDDFLFSQIENKKSDLVIPVHYINNCIYQEIKTVKKLKKAAPADLIKIKEFLTATGFPKSYGLTENNIIYRKHDSPIIRKIMEDWWDMLKIVSRDQLSLCYLLWKYKIPVDSVSIPNARLENKHFAFYLRS